MPVSVATPYVTPAMLTSRPAGIAWNVVPTLTASGADQMAQLASVCQTSTSQVDTYCNQPLRASAVTDELQGPGYPRVSVDRSTGIGKLITRRWPVTAVNAVQLSQARAFPAQWSLVPADQYRIAVPVLHSAAATGDTGPSGGNRVDIAPGYLDLRHPRGHWLVSLSVTCAWPHCGLTAQAEDGAMTVQVDDVTGWPGFTGWLIDGQSTELVTATAVTATSPVQLPGAGGTVDAGPGTVTLAAPLAFGHQPGAVLTAMPLAVLHAAALNAVVQALETLTAIAAQSANGQTLPGGMGALAFEAEAILDPFRRVM